MPKPKPKPLSGRQANDVHWHCPGRKKPIAYSTIAARDAINCVAGNGDTLRTVRRKFDFFIYDKEATDVLDAYIKYGFGEWIYDKGCSCFRRADDDRE